MILRFSFPKYVDWPGLGHGLGQHAGGGGARPWPSGAEREANGAGPGTLGPQAHEDCEP